MVDPVGSTQRFYTRWAWLYDLIAVHTPGVGSRRTAAVDRLDPQPGDTIVEMSCGSGANSPLFRDRVGPTGTVIGVDFSPGVLSVAADRVDRKGWQNVHIVCEDATQPLVGSLVGEDHAVDCLFASVLCLLFQHRCRDNLDCRPYTRSRWETFNYRQRTQ